ncbi:flagellar biosynthetic protein FliO [Temperatibacter marinus]|uniref:Flagellar biosynthetic protein FliO n=1 Tax=Temperatibacter marinus TaxID=1456591 RepID=A0AA52EHG5_9PROT|nr:flagellar biosynthetic protein FliO [Temperatibacter marinus]WND02141.1 flagellar biosynthetic protein FliO [Temperatibacter marinus]
METDILFALTGLIVILIVMYLLAWLLKRSGLMTGQLGSKEATIVIKETKFIDGRNRLHVVEWYNKRYLISSGANGCSLIGVDCDVTPEKSSLDFQQELTDSGLDYKSDQKN